MRVGERISSPGTMTTIHASGAQGKPAESPAVREQEWTVTHSDGFG
jgi:hypothetical protein